MTISREQLARFGGDAAGHLKPEPLGSFDMDGYLAEHRFEVARRKPWQSHAGGLVYELSHCLFNVDHAGGSAAFTMEDGRPGFRCQHDGCRGRTIKDVFAAFPPTQSRGIRRNLPVAEFARADAGDKTPAASEDDAADIDTLPEFPEHAWRGVFADYRAAMHGTTEAPDVAHFASVWAALAATLGRKVYMYAGDPVYPNVYLAIFGGTGDKKTTAMRRPLGLDLIPPHVKLVRGVGSAEGLADAVKREDGADAVALFFWEELTALLARGRWVGATILEFLTETFDCPPTWGLEYRRNKVEISNPTPTIITGTTTEWFWKNARAEDFHGGFGNRFLFLTGPRKPPIPNPAEPEKEAMQRVREVFGRIAQRGVSIAKFDADAERLWKMHYIQSESQATPGLHGAATKRIHVYARKLAMVYAAVDGTLPDITGPQLRAAIAVGKYASKCVQRLLDVQASTSSREGELEQRFIEWLKRHRTPVPKRFMQQTLHKKCGSCEVFNRVIRSLELAGHIEIRDKQVYLSG